MAALGCAISPESALKEVLPDPSGDAADDQADDDGSDVTDDAEDDEAQGSDEPTSDDEDDEGDLDSTKDAVRVNEPDASAARDAGATPPKDAGTSKPDATVATAVDAGASIKDAAVVDAATGALSSCSAGTYVGTFSVDIGGGLSRDSFEGSVSLQLAGTGDNLKIQTGSLNGEDAEGHSLTAKVSGSLNCLTKKLEGATLSDGVFEQRGLISTVRFSGTMAASFAGDTSALQGTWTLESSLHTRSGTGRFTAIKQP